ncbi:MAG: alpha/beta hydrolase [Candidatus Latescibacteria bacterium]|nr:alpha/beta hydrolase [Candidatus Latescibacterota bacterium]
MSQPHPEIRKALDIFEQTLSENGLTDLCSGGVDAARAFQNARKLPEDMLPPIYKVENRTIPGPGGDIPIRIYRPSGEQNLPLLMWFHGGGWVLGTLENSELRCRTLANAVGCVVVSVDYRLAPETPFPGAINDCAAATTWAASATKTLGIDPHRIAVGGDSAGGNLAACVALRARDTGPNLCFQLLVYPIITADFDRPSYIENAEGLLLTRNTMQWFWDCYVPNIQDRTNPEAAPIHAKDLSGLPPALILAAEFDPLRDEAEAYCAALKAAGVDAVTQRYNGMIHAFFMMSTENPVDEIANASREAIEALCRAFNIE